jgi:transcriptional regulator with XRE-family HTH domain
MNGTLISHSENAVAERLEHCHVDVYERFAENLLSLRQRRRMSQEELASRAAVHRSQISLMESGKRLPRLDTLIKLAGALEVEVPRLVEGIAWEPTITTDGQFEVSEPTI